MWLLSNQLLVVNLHLVYENIKLIKKHPYASFNEFSDTFTHYQRSDEGGAWRGLSSLNKCCITQVFWTQNLGPMKFLEPSRKIFWFSFITEYHWNWLFHTKQIIPKLPTIKRAKVFFLSKFKIWNSFSKV